MRKTNDGHGGWIETYEGRHFHYFNKAHDEEAITLEDIAHALSLQCRYNGHCKFFVSVAEHSLQVAYLAKINGEPPLVQLQALLHDAVEAYVGDLPAPLKPSLHDYQRVEDDVAHRVYARLRVPYPDCRVKSRIHIYDLTCCREEAKVLMLSRGEDWGWNLPVIETAVHVQGLTPPTAEALFLKVHEFLCRDLAQETEDV